MSDFDQQPDGLTSPNNRKVSKGEVDSLLSTEGSKVKTSNSDPVSEYLFDKLNNSNDVIPIINLDAAGDYISFNLVNPLLKNNYTATADPTINDDSGDGYAIGSVWWNTTDISKFWVCLNPAVGVALWKPIYYDGEVKYNNTDTPGKLDAKILDGSNITFTIGGTTFKTMTPDLTATGVTSGSYINADITVDDKGRITAASNGSANTLFDQVVSPTALSANTNDYSITGLSSANVIYMQTTGANYDLTGIVSTGIANGKTYFLYNVGTAGDIKLKNNNANSTAANRFITNGDVIIKNGMGVIITYDTTSSRWRVNYFK